MPNRHLKYGGSTIARTMACPGWASLAEQIPRVEGEASEAARRGTALHEAMEYLVETGRQPSEISGLYFYGIEIEEEHMEALEAAKAALKTLFDGYNLRDFKIEPFVEIIPGTAGGSIDLLAKSRDGKTVVVVDYKFGHMPVNVEENMQLLFYALCADADPATSEYFEKAERVVMAIIQPEHPEGTLQTWETNISRLDSFEESVAKAIGEAEGGKPSFKAGDHCQYCPALAICPIKTGEAHKAAKLPAPVVEELDTYMPMLNDLEKWIAEVRKLAQKHMENGGAIKGFKLVNKRPTRMWSDESALAKWARGSRKVKASEIYESKLKSPAQMEKLLKEKGIDPDTIADYISSVSSGLTIAPDSDKREAALPPGALKRLKDRL